MNLLKNRVKEIREELGYNQDIVCVACGISRQTLSKIENNPFYNLSLELAFKISTFLKADIYYMFGYDRAVFEFYLDEALIIHANKNE